MENQVQIIESLINEVSIYFISAVDVKGFPHTKAMLSPRKREGVKYFYFTTALSSVKAIQYCENPKANLYFCNPETYNGILLVGTMEVLVDEKLKMELWRDGDTLYHSLGITDPDYCVLKFTADYGRHYSNLSSEDFNVE